MATRLARTADRNDRGLLRLQRFLRRCGALCDLARHRSCVSPVLTIARFLLGARFVIAGSGRAVLIKSARQEVESLRKAT
jgi:hypothetical protein